MGVPMFTQNALIGFINLDSRTPGAFNNQEQAAAVQIFANQAATAIDKTRLLENLQHSNQELYLAYDNTLEGWGKALELRDKETQGHTQRVTDLTLKLARQMGISEAELIHVRRGVLMHDIGKMGVPDSILHKTGPLTVSEMDEMKKHTQYAYDLIHPIAYLRPAIDIAYYHHEWWDGNGYPHMLKGEEIPLSARIFAIIDVWDALLSDRPYRKAWSRKKVIQYIRDLSGKQFDPHVVTEFFKMIEDGIKPVKKKAVK
jgi:HD-GYP domain-containing protein (c-di-GMP phosphodiesterase class II)